MHLLKHLSERFPQYLKFEGGPTFNFYVCFLILFLFRLYGVMYRGFTRLEAVGLVCNFSGKLLTGIFSGQVVQFFLQPPCLETSDDEFFPLYSYNKYLCIVLFSWRTEAVKSYLIVVPEQSLKTVEEKKAVYQIRRPLGLAFAISFWWLGELLPFYI